MTSRLRAARAAVSRLKSALGLLLRRLFGVSGGGVHAEASENGFIGFGGLRNLRPAPSGRFSELSDSLDAPSTKKSRSEDILHTGKTGGKTGGLRGLLKILTSCLDASPKD